MCGVLGIAIGPTGQGPCSAERFQSALASLRHRGPDAQGQYQDGNLWLGHTRLSILDLSSAGNQPMQSADGRFVISYNGEVYNFRELAKENNIENLRSGSDTEVVLRLFSEHGIDSLTKLNGMFAFAVYDVRGTKAVAGSGSTRDQATLLPAERKPPDLCFRDQGDRGA